MQNEAKRCRPDFLLISVIVAVLVYVVWNQIETKWYHQTIRDNVNGGFPTELMRGVEYSEPEFIDLKKDLENCITCGGIVSTNAVACPHCGEPNPKTSD